MDIVFLRSFLDEEQTPCHNVYAPFSFIIKNDTDNSLSL